MAKTRVTRDVFLEDAQGRTFADVVNDPDKPFDEVLKFFDDEDRQRRMEESELHHERSPMAGVVRELESQPAINRFLASPHARRSTRLRQAIGVLVRMIMEGRGWRKTGRKGSLGVAARRELPERRHTIQEVWRFGLSVRKDMSDPRECRSVRFASGVRKSSPLLHDNLQMNR